MNNKFLLTPYPIDSTKMQMVFTTDCCCIYANKSCFKSYGKIHILLHGYVVARSHDFSQFQKYNGVELVNKSYSQYGDGFINHIKGNFVIILIDNNIIKIFTDHFGLSQCFYCEENKTIIAVSDSVNLLKEAGISLVPDQISLLSKSLLHRNVPGYTSYKNIYQTAPATYIELTESGSKISNYWTPDALLETRHDSYSSKNFAPFAELIKSNFSNFQAQLKPSTNTITLTGGKDSRTGLSALISLGISPYGFTYGNKNSRDAIYAANLARKLSLQHHVFDPPSSSEWFDRTADEILAYGNPEISIHRAHRLNAFQEMSQIAEPGTAYYCGNMAGEFLMGPYYDDLIHTEFLTHFWEKRTLLPFEPFLKKYMHRTSTVHHDDVLHRLAQMKSFDPCLSKNMCQFFGMFENGIPHHAQDIFLATQYFDFTYPFFIDIDFLEALFGSPFSFFHTNNKTLNLLQRYKLFEFNLNIQHILCPAMDTIPFAKRGSYNTEEFLRGKLYWSAVKSLRFLFQRRKYPPSFVYQSGFKDFLNKHLLVLKNQKDNILHEFYDIPKALSDLHKVKFPSPEGRLHKFSNIVMLYLHLKRFG